uniref:Adhesion G protein-coupled receptor E8 n=1 Tax=Amphiprion ocellaris TaxID=80972 RepID=A0A3Q1ATY9_AMPOC
MLTVPPSDIDECFNSTVCGPDSVCTNTPGTYECACEIGYEPTDPEQDPSETNICLDIDECVKHDAICGPNANCTNTIGSYTCTCLSGYRLNNPSVIASYANSCTDIDECFETPGICGRQTICTNVPGTFYCSCPEGFFPSTGILWILGTSFCESELRMQSRYHLHSNTLIVQSYFYKNIIRLNCDSIFFLPVSLQTVANSLSASMVRVVPYKSSVTMMIFILLSVFIVSRVTYLSLMRWRDRQRDSGVVGHLHLVAFSGSAAVAFLTLDGMESLLSHTYFKTENRTEMYSDVITAILPSVNNTNLTEPVNFTIQHRQVLPRLSRVKITLVGEAAKQKIMRWSVEGCGVAFTNENYTVCSCSHLSTFALILQIAEPPPQSDFLEWLNRMCVIVGLFFFALAIFTFLLCSWNPKINNTARSDWFQDSLSVSLQLACTVMAGLLHFLVVASFVWMLLEALQLHLLVRRLSKVQVIQRDGLPRPLLYLIGYGVPFVIVGVSALVYSDGYGATEAKACWLSEKRHFNWALTGPVITILGLNCVLFGATLWSLRPTLANMKSDVSQSKDTRLIVFKILAQFVILGCTWILGLYQTNLFFQVLFIVLNSQQGTFLFIVHCLLNKEVCSSCKWMGLMFLELKLQNYTHMYMALGIF